MKKYRFLSLLFFVIFILLLGNKVYAANETENQKLRKFDTSLTSKIC